MPQLKAVEAKQPTYRRDAYLVFDDTKTVGPRCHKNGFYKGGFCRDKLSSNPVALQGGVAATLSPSALQLAT